MRFECSVIFVGCLNNGSKFTLFCELRKIKGFKLILKSKCLGMEIPFKNLMLWGQVDIKRGKSCLKKNYSLLKSL